MKFGYSYKATDGSRHEATQEAKSKEDVFARLRQAGIRPIKVWELHSRFYLPLSLRVIIILAILVLGLSAFIFLHHREWTQGEAQTTPRHYIYGDPVLLQELEAENYVQVFADAGEQYLARYAIPGLEVKGARPSDEEAHNRFKNTLKESIVFDPSDAREVKELKLIVNGMKDELRAYLKNGNGTISSYLKRLDERQEKEAEIFNRVAQELENETDELVREAQNNTLRALGLKTIPRKKAR